MTNQQICINDENNDVIAFMNNTKHEEQHFFKLVNKINILNNSNNNNNDCLNLKKLKKLKK